MLSYMKSMYDCVLIIMWFIELWLNMFRKVTVTLDHQNLINSSRQLAKDG